MSCKCQTTTFIPADEIRYIDMSPLPRPIAVEPRDGFRIWLKYDDGEEGEVDLSHIPIIGFFKAWNDREVFERVYITEYRSVAWTEDIDLCPDDLYMRMTGKTLEELMPSFAESLRRSGWKGWPLRADSPLDAERTRGIT